MCLSTCRIRQVLRQIREDLLAPQGWLLLEVPNFYAHNSYELPTSAASRRIACKKHLPKPVDEVICLRQHGYPRSELFKLYLNVLARPSTNPPADYQRNPSALSHSSAASLSLGAICAPA